MAVVVVREVLVLGISIRSSSSSRRSRSSSGSSGTSSTGIRY